MSRPQLKPGPLPKSCLTCRQRRKKCDLTRPCCERCLRGGFKCLGYTNHELRGGAHQEEPATPIPSQSRPVPSTVLASRSRSNPVGFNPEQSLTVSQNCQHPNHTCAGGCLAPSTFKSLHPVLTHWVNDGERSFEAALDAQACKSPSNGMIHIMCASIPPSVDATKIIEERRVINTIYEYQMQRVTYWFTVPPVSVRDSMINRLQNSKTTIWAIYLGTNLFRELGEDPRGAGVVRCINWIDKLEQRFSSYFHNSSTLNDAADCLLAELELAFLRFATINIVSGYAMIQKALPKFLFLVAADPSLYVEHPSGNLVVSLPRVLGASQYELKRFIIYDIATALVLGTPPLVEYGCDCECNPASHGLEWIHGVPVALVETISQVNSWRAGSRVAPLDDWRNLERRVLAWEPQPVVVEGDEIGTESVARLAVQEGWRHVALIYIYMGMSGASSHDSRVQTSIRQIVQLGETVANLPIGVHMFVHCVMVGLGARYEKHRSLVWKRLLSFKGTHIWFFQGREFCPVLDHLWHGVGAGGAPVTWDDYVRSRCTVLPV
ncbi:fungal Zn(2)-cys(6) binuclear cluster domain protein [Rhizoctonia solani AG-3 Rhs1AP]|uniref:Fungal Zn(2)-cys(6) binuclear cluster domain protein n=1 Tax=Rhizoctonia solani AG-3 Rhs1AP TaxID=1086054 RepID=X8JEJ1_9AGAM|nr:fungal Zn(2)-cys(6) binuclear cluster domain protein [Rhizoctonia solani AG-3 Rhs1AP]